MNSYLFFLWNCSILNHSSYFYFCFFYLSFLLLFSNYLGFESLQICLWFPKTEVTNLFLTILHNRDHNPFQSYLSIFMKLLEYQIIHLLLFLQYNKQYLSKKTFFDFAIFINFISLLIFLQKDLTLISFNLVVTLIFYQNLYQQEYEM